ncbi:MAG: membrane protein insertion efficiency factor YidD [Cellvibrionales bacterium]|nr:membrane protein insertion efficiency factor YidD [Cellvibrionales bacterium]
MHKINKTKPSPLASVALTLIRGYQIGLSPLFGPRCRFYPSCSSYTAQAIRTHGLAHGGYLGLRRLLRCHPWHPGGIDPVPAPPPKTSPPC